MSALNKKVLEYLRTSNASREIIDAAIYVQGALEAYERLGIRKPLTLSLERSHSFLELPSDLIEIEKKIITTLSQSERALNVKEIAQKIDSSRNTVAKYLSVLELRNLVCHYKSGPTKLYSLAH